MRVGVVEWPEDLSPKNARWGRLCDEIVDARLDLLVTNELPFGAWLAAGDTFDLQAAKASVAAHAIGEKALLGLAPAVLSSRPLLSRRERLVNEAVLIEPAFTHVVHRKIHLPSEPGWHEETWFASGRGGFHTTEVAGVRLGALLCTDAMFTEHARRYASRAAHLIAIPRTTGSNTDIWFAAGKMAAIVSGCWVVSSNRSGETAGGVRFGGAGFAFDPAGALVGVTSPDKPLLVVEVDPALAERQKAEYPCYLAKTWAPWNRKSAATRR
ncbi:MAG TPA: carbon-nitrogen hydrolase family protein [Caulobacteraceae bacterium]|jgi:N-carbamoylputrescine amidase|nr:carbon-nitrogen hydrolase family protein [Caulobacteraceae bacterium]